MLRIRHALIRFGPILEVRQVMSFLKVAQACRLLRGVQQNAYSGIGLVLGGDVHFAVLVEIPQRDGADVPAAGFKVEGIGKGARPWLRTSET